MNPSLALVLGGLALLQGPRPVFTVREVDGLTRVSADRAAITARAALESLGDAMDWTVVFASDRLQDDFGRTAVDLAFDDQDPRTVARLVAVAAGGDVVFDDRAAGTGLRTTVHVVTPPDPSTEAGRERLRRLAIDWYRNFLTAELRTDPLVEADGMKVRMQLGHLLLGQGDLLEAVRVFRSVVDRDPAHDYVPLAMLRIAEALYESGEHERALRWAERLSALNPAYAETARGTVLLGETLLALDRNDQCVRRMEASLLRLEGTPEIVEAMLILGRAELARGRPDKILRNLRTLREGHRLEELTPPQFLDYHFLLGAGAHGVEAFEHGMEALEVFLGFGDGDARRGRALVLLGECYRGLGKFIAARAAAIEAEKHFPEMPPEWRRRTRILGARSAIDVGDEANAFDALELEVRKPDADPEVAFELAELFLEVRRFERAASTMRYLVRREREGETADRARREQCRALSLQAATSGNWELFVRQAVSLAREVGDPDVQSAIARMVGSAYEKLGDDEAAARAYTGILE